MSADNISQYMKRTWACYANVMQYVIKRYYECVKRNGQLLNSERHNLQKWKPLYCWLLLNKNLNYAVRYPTYCA